MPRTRKDREETASEPRGRVAWMAIGAGAIAVGLGAVLLADAPIKIAGAVFCLTVLLGLWRGGLRIIGLVVGLIFAVVLAPPLGRTFEGVVSGVLGTTGLTNRLLSALVFGTFVAVLVSGLAGTAARRVLRARSDWRSWDRVAGGALGIVEGGLLAMMVLWAPLALAPIAQSRVNEAESIGVPNPLASALVRLGKQIGGSPIGGLAIATNPFSQAQLLALAEDFALVSRHPPALEYFLATPVMRAVAELPSVTTGIARVKADRTIGPLFEQGTASVGAIRAVLDSPTLLTILDETSIVEDLTPRLGEITIAIREARALVPATPPLPPPPPE